jgi:excinuclease ABC subunit C
MLLAGRSRELVKALEAGMWRASEDLDFEAAAALRDQMRCVERTLERQAVVLADPLDMDVVGVGAGEEGLALGVLFVRQGRLTGSSHFHWPGFGAEDAPEAVDSFLTQFYTPARMIPPRILVPYRPGGPEEHEGEARPVQALADTLADHRQGPVTLAGPRNASEKQLLETARRNALEALARDREPPLSETLAARLGLDREAVRVEAVDVSHLGGTGVRAGMVVFEEGRPVKSDYRIYNLPGSEESFDDYRALGEWAGRRAASGPPWPDLLLVDGGRGQLLTVERALEAAGVPEAFELASIAKGESRAAGELEDRVFRPGRKNPVNLKPGSRELLYLQRLRDAAHDFVLSRQRRGRSRELLKSELTAMPGVGPGTARLLWDAFGSIQAMAEATEEQLRQVPGIGPGRARAIHACLGTWKVRKR